MQRIEGPDLLSFIRSHPSGALSEACARPLFTDLLCAIRHAHLRGYLHCDLKPENIRLTAGCESAVVVDWGLARHILRQPALITQVRVRRGWGVRGAEGEGGGEVW
jgi:serine/threonine protein kinase